MKRFNLRVYALIVNEFQEISGAPYIYIPVKEQERVKKSSTLDTFSRLSGIENIDDKNKQNGHTKELSEQS